MAVSRERRESSRRYAEPLCDEYNDEAGTMDLDSDLHYLLDRRNQQADRGLWNWKGTMDWCCFLSIGRSKGPPSSAAGSRKTPPDEKGTPQASPNPKAIDLLSDEGIHFQDDLWQLVRQEKIKDTKDAADPFYHELATQATFDSSLQALTEQYTKHGFAKRIPKVKMILLAVQPFTTAVSTMIHSDPNVSCLVWGSVQLVLQNVMTFNRIYEDTSSMLHDLSKVLPMFHAFVDVLHTPRLHQALREVYAVYIDFCFSIIKFLRSNKCYALLQIQWSNIDKQFNETKDLLESTKKNFEAEAHLADVQAQAKRHREVLTQFTTLSTRLEGEPFTTVPSAQNPLFTGRDEVLQSINEMLKPSFEASDASLRSRRSVTIHGIGGMGKTETALEYTYRYRECFACIFWLHAETNSTLLESFLAMTKKIGLGDQGTVHNQTQAGLEWLETTAYRWLLVFDNVVDITILRKYWPRGTRGAIILTSQDPDVVNLTTNEIHLQPMMPQEGSSMIQRYLRRGGSEQQAAEALSIELGGLPLAIAHFAGYVAKSQCTIEQISRSLVNRVHSSQIWRAQPHVSTSAYDYTLATVWDLAWQRLSDDARKLLNLIAFLNPDSIPEDMFIGSGQESKQSPYWGVHRFNEAVRILRERHLIERDTTPNGVSLRTHRALQRDVLHRLDSDIEERQALFVEVVGIIRNVYPQQDVLGRGDSSQWSDFEKYLPQVISVNSAFLQSVPSIGSDLSFATILRDAGYYLMNRTLQFDAVELLQTAEAVCDSLLDTKPVEARLVLVDCLSPLQRYDQLLGVKGRSDALVLNEKALMVRKELVANKPKKEWTEAELFGFGRTAVDSGCAFAQFSKMDEASEEYGKALEYFKLTGLAEGKLAGRMGALYSFMAWIAATRQDGTAAREFSSRSCSLVAQAVGPDNPLSHQTMFVAGMAAFTIGDITEALKLHQTVFDGRLRLRGGSDSETLASQYNLAVCHQNLGQLESAERHLRQNLENSCVTAIWREEDVSRTKFRLALVLRAQNRPSEAADWQKEALAARTGQHVLAATANDKEYTDKDDMTLFDQEVTLWHGRTTGIWSSGTKW